MNRRSFLLAAPAALAAGKFRLCLAGLTHDHARGFLNTLLKRSDVELAGIAEPDTALHSQYGARFKLGASSFHTSLPAMLDKLKPDAVATFASTFDHLRIVQECARRRIPVMMEKPLAVSREHAYAIRDAAAKANIPVLVNYETTWYRSHAQLRSEIALDPRFGRVRKMVAMDGHQGPKEINVGPEFFGWLTDPEKNGAGALFDFGCYGANLMTWLMDNRRPDTVTARLQTFKPHIYARVDDEATVVVEYPGAQGIIQGSWNWPYGRKDFEVYTEHGYAIANGGGKLRMLRPEAQEEELLTPPELPADERDSVSYLMAVVQGRLKTGGLSSLENNLIATEILVAARESARSGKSIRLPAA
ncbi:MAG: Gfo/Idh/MocA family oxidoreductase [Acidobacteriota bacterium]